jgi:hypothetical protein
MTEQAIILTLARHIAKREVKKEWKRQRIKCSHFEAWELTRAADAYFEAHPELLEHAAEIVRNDPRLRTLAAQDERRRKRNRR